jgi:hypothetical protein
MLSSALAVPSFAQTEDATISGRVTDQTGAVVAGVSVQLQSAERGTAQETTTNGSGIYLFPAVHPGVYHITVRKEGFHQVDDVGLTANVQAHIEQNFKLQVGSVSESVTVTADAINVNTTDAAVSTVIDHKFVESIPLNGRSFQDLITLTPGVSVTTSQGPGVSGSLTVNGQRTEANYFTVDGVSANVGTGLSLAGLPGTGGGWSGSTPALTNLGTTQSLVSVDALQEFRASTSTYSAEYGRTPGGQFAFTTRSGTNAWHGSAYDYFRNEALDANNWFLNQVGEPKQKERQNDFGGTLGGPIILPKIFNGRDKTFFFFSYEGLRLWTPQGLTRLGVPDQTLRASAPTALQPALNAFPLPNAGEDGENDGRGIYQAPIDVPSSIDSLSARVDHNLGSKFKVFGRYAQTESVVSNWSGLGTYVDSSSKYRLVTVGTTTLITSRQSNELRFNFTQNNTDDKSRFSGQNSFDLSSLPGANGKPFPQNGSRFNISLYFDNCFGDLNAGCSSLDRTHRLGTQRQFNLTDTYTWSIGAHTLRRP